MTTTTIFILLIAFQIKHFLADFPLQNRYMLGKFKDEWDFVLPLLAHVSVHAIGTFLITVWFGFWQAIALSIFGAVAHFIMDRLKAGKKYLGRYEALTKETFLSATSEQIKSNTYFWWSIGIDQWFHNICDLLIVYLIVK